MLYIPWKKGSNMLGNFHTYEDAFNTKHPEIIKKLAIYEPMSSILESALEEFEKDTLMNYVLLHQLSMTIMMTLMLMKQLHMNLLFMDQIMHLDST